MAGSPVTDDPYRPGRGSSVTGRPPPRLRVDDPDRPRLLRRRPRARRRGAAAGGGAAGAWRRRRPPRCGTTPTWRGTGTTSSSSAAPGTTPSGSPSSWPGPTTWRRSPGCSTRRRCCTGTPTSATSPHFEAAGVPIVPTQFLEPGDRPGARLRGRRARRQAGRLGRLARHAAARLATTSSGPARTPRRCSTATGRSWCSPTCTRSTSTARPRCSTSTAGSPTPCARARCSPPTWSWWTTCSRRRTCRRASRPPPSASSPTRSSPPSRTGSATDLLYARVDLLPSPEGPRLLELELAEPSLFLDHHLPAVDRLADAVLRRAR